MMLIKDYFQAKNNNQSVCIVAEKSILKEYRKFSGGAKAELKDNPAEATDDKVPEYKTFLHNWCYGKPKYVFRMHFQHFLMFACKIKVFHSDILLSYPYPTK